MEDLPLPRLTPSDPENQLPYESRQRIARAFIEYELIRQRALNEIDLGEHWNTPQEESIKKKASLDAGRVVLRVEAEEFAKLGLPRRRFREIMSERIEGFIYSCGLSNVQRDLLEAEASQTWVELQGITSAPTQVETVVQPRLSSRERIKAFMEKKSLDDRAFARLIGASVRTVATAKTGKPVGKSTRAAIAKALGTTPEELFPVKP